jgi:biopolymer transport protein ExbD
MTPQITKKGLVALFFAAVILGTNFIITSRFVSDTRKALELESSGAVRLPVAPPDDQRSLLPTVHLTVHANGMLSMDGEPVTQDSLTVSLRAKLPAKVVVHPNVDMKYEQLKALLAALRDIGANDLTVKVNETK